jgi:hypothetical protein
MQKPPSRCRTGPWIGMAGAGGETSHPWIVSSPGWAWVPRGYDQAMRWTEVPAAAWRTPQELVEEGFRRSRVVMLNEAHHGLSRCVRTRQLGRQLLPSAHAMGVRHLAMEALQPGDAEAANTTRRPPDDAGGYLAQPDMAHSSRPPWNSAGRCGAMKPTSTTPRPPWSSRAP